MGSFLKDFSFTGLSTIIITLLSFVNNVIVTRQIGPDGRGKYAVISNLVILLALLVGEGIRKTNVLLSSEYKKQLNIIVSQNIIYGIAAFFLFCIFYFFRRFWIFLLPNLSDLLLFLSLSITLLTIFWQAFQALFLGLQDIFRYNIIQIVPIVFNLILNVIIIYIFNLTLTAIIFNLLLSNLLTLLVGIYFLRHQFKFQFPDKPITKRTSAIVVKSTSSAAEFFLLFRGDIFLVNFFCGSTPAGIYAIAVFFSEILQKIPNVAGPLLISKSTINNPLKTSQDTSRLTRVIFLINLISVIIILFVGRHLIIFIFGFDFEQAYPVLLFLLPALLFFGPGSIFYSYFIGKSYPSFVLWVNGIASILNISLNIFLIPSYGIKAAAAVSSITYFLWTVLYIFYFYKQTKISLREMIFIKKQDIKFLISSIKI